MTEEEIAFLVFKSLIVIYVFGGLISWTIFYDLAIKGILSLDDECETYFQAFIESFLASTIWFIIMLAYLATNCGKINRENKGDSNEANK